MLKEQKTWNEAASTWLLETSHKRTHDEDKAKLRWLKSYLNGINLDEITRDTIRSIALVKLQESSPSTANRYLALVRAILRKAANEWDWIDKPPHIKLFREPRRRVRWLLPKQAKTLLNELPEHQVHPVVFALATGLRQSNVLQLRWQQIDLKRRVAWLYGDQTKNEEDLSISLNDSAMSVLYARRFINRDWVFTYRGNPIKRLTTRAWYKALDRAGIENFRWHDLRHTWASWLVQKGVPLYALQEMGGWKTASMVRRYAHLSPAHNLKYAQVIDDDLRVSLETLVASD